MAYIGKNVIENLTTAMYEDLHIIYREYIQNSADSIDKSVTESIITQEEARIEIEIEQGKRKITIMDNGNGVSSARFQKVMSSIADSEKDRSEDKGFRGIGRLGAISSCDILRFSCSAKNENVMSICTWNAKEVREILVDKSQNIAADELVDLVTEYSTAPCDPLEHFFKVELINVIQSASELLNIESVKEYLRAVAPIPFETGFIYKYKIYDFAKANSFAIDEYQVFLNGERLFKPYKTNLYESKGNNRQTYDTLVDIGFEIFKDSKDDTLAWMWYGISKFEKQIPPINVMRGIRLRKGNIQIGNEYTFASHEFYSETRGGLYFVGEVYAIHADLIPNARRDYFNLNDTCREFEQQLRPLFRDRFKKIYHYANDYKKALQKQQEFEKAAQEYQEKIDIGGFIDADDKANQEKAVEEKKAAAGTAARQIELRNNNERNDDVLSKVYDALRKAYPIKSKASNSNDIEVGGPANQSDHAKNIQGKQSGDSEIIPKDIEQDSAGKTNQKKKQFITQSLSQYSKKEQKLIGHIYKIISSIMPRDTATMVIGKIQEELSK